MASGTKTRMYFTLTGNCSLALSSNRNLTAARARIRYAVRNYTGLIVIRDAFTLAARK